MNFEPEAGRSIMPSVPKYIMQHYLWRFVEAVASENGARMQAWIRQQAMQKR